MRIFITGASEGIGRATALKLASMGHELILHGRNENKVKETVAIITKAGYSKPDYFLADFADLQQVKNLAQNIKSKYTQIDVLLHNAGIFLANREVTKEGIEKTWAINHLAVALLTREILPLIPQGGRIVVTSSKLHETSHPRWDDINFEKGYSMMGAYGVSKLYNAYFTQYLAEELKEKNITVNCLHPGVVKTKLARDMKGIMGILYEIIAGIFFISPEKGAETSVFLATDASVASVSGKYFDAKKVKAYNPQACNKNHIQKMKSITDTLLQSI